MTRPIVSGLTERQRMTPRNWHYIPGQRWRLWRDDTASPGGAVYRATNALGADVTFRLTAGDSEETRLLIPRPSQRDIARHVLRRDHDPEARFHN